MDAEMLKSKSREVVATGAYPAEHALMETGPSSSSSIGKSMEHPVSCSVIL